MSIAARGVLRSTRPMPDPRHQSVGPHRRFVLEDRVRTDGRGEAQDVRQDRLERRLDTRDNQCGVVFRKVRRIYMYDVYDSIFFNVKNGTDPTWVLRM